MPTASTPPQFDESRRSSSRLPLSIPIVLSGSDESGKSFVEKTATVVINRRGAKIIVKQQLRMGARLELTVPHLNRSSPATVVWLGAKKGEEQEVGLALILNRTDDFWGVDFPGDAVGSLKAGPAPETKGGEPEAPEKHEALTAQRGGRHGDPAAPASRPEILMVNPEVMEKLSAIAEDLVQQAAAETLKDALTKLMQSEERLDVARKEATEQAQGHLDRLVQEALEQLQAQAMEHLGRAQLEFDQTLQELTQGAEERMRARLAEYEEHLAASEKNMRSQLAEKLSNLSANFLRA